MTKFLDLPLEVISRILSCHWLGLVEVASLSRISTGFRQALACSSVHLMIRDVRVNDGRWRVLWFGMRRSFLGVSSLNLRSCNLNAEVLKSTLPTGLQNLSLSKCFSVDGGRMLDQLAATSIASSRDGADSGDQPLRQLLLADLPQVHLNLRLPSLANLVCLGLTNCNLHPPSGNGMVAFADFFIVRLSDALSGSTPDLPSLKYLCLGGADLGPPPSDEHTNRSGMESEAAESTNSGRGIPSADGSSGRGSGGGEARAGLLVLEATFLSDAWRTALRRLFGRVLCPASSAIVCLATTPLDDLNAVVTSSLSARTVGAHSHAWPRRLCPPVLAAALAGACESRRTDGMTPLHLAAAQGDATRVSWLLAAGAPLDACVR